ncbi:MAG: DUF1565 domain-containing protein [Phycisphaerae bacterium]|nr:DUF1565 domain-containing protein [Phycisphaerae bacterium]
MKKGKSLSILAIVLCFSLVSLADYYGTDWRPGDDEPMQLMGVEDIGQSMSFSGLSSLTSLPFSSYVWTSYELVFFSYEDGTELELYDSNGNPVSLTPNVLNKGQHTVVSAVNGVYLVAGSNKFAVLTGDAVAHGVCGYYAMDAEGMGVSTEFYTYVPRIAHNNSERFIVFAHQDNTTITVRRDLSNGSYQHLASFSLNKGQHWARSDLASEYLHITANKGVSVLTCYDQSYFVPCSGGQWSGTEFFTYVSNIPSDPNIQSWPEDLTVFAYDDNTNVLIKDSITHDTIWEDTLDSGRAYPEQYPNGADKYITIITDKPVTVAVQPWVSITTEYSQGVFVADRTGRAIGTEFIGTTLSGGYLNILAYSDDTEVQVYNSETGLWVASYNLDEGQLVNANPGNGLWKIVSDKDVSVYSGCSTHTANFAPLKFNKYPIRLTKTSDAEGCLGVGDTITYTIEWENPTDQTFYDAFLLDWLPEGVTYPQSGYTIEFGDPNDPEAAPFTLIPPDPGYDAGTHSYAWPLDDIAPYASGYVQLTVVVNDKAMPGGLLRNVAELYATFPDPNGLPVTEVLAKATTDANVCCYAGITEILYVDRSAVNGNKTGLNWQNAFLDLRDALDYAWSSMCAEVHSIYVAQGTFRPGDYEADTFALPDGVSVYGGFPTGGSPFEHRNPKRYETILSGRIDDTTRNDTVVTMGQETLLDGFTVTKSAVSGYAIYGSGVNFTIENCTIIDNEGYGIRAVNSNVILKWCTIRNNDLDGIYHEGEDFDLFVENCWIRQSGRYGIRCINSTPIVRNSIISESDLAREGREGIRMINSTTSPILYNNTIAHNKATGIFYFNSRDPNDPIMPDVQNCILWYNNNDGDQFSGFGKEHFRHSCIYDPNDPTGESVSFDLNYNFSTNPRLAYIDPNNVRIRFDSPCRDMGNPYLNYDDQLDMDSKDRVYGMYVDIGAYEVVCGDVSNAMDWNADGLVNLYEFNQFSRAWLSHDPNDPALTDPNHVDYYYLTDPNSPGYVTPSSIAAWYPHGHAINYVATGTSQYRIDLADLVFFLDNAPWLWKACWVDLEEMQMQQMMGGDEELMMFAQTETVEEVLIIQDKSVQEQLLDLATAVIFLEQLWLEEPYIRQEINAEDWQRFMEAVYGNLLELQSGTVQIE